MEAIALRSFIDSNIVAICRADIHGGILEVNDAFVKLLGYTREDYLEHGVTWHQLTPPEYRHLDEEAIEQIRKIGQALPWEKEYIRKDGSRVDVLVGVVASDTTGDDCFAFVIDISQRKQLENQMREMEAKFRMLADALPQMVWIADYAGHSYYNNQRFYEYTGLTREEEDGWIWLNIVHPDDQARCLEDGRRAITQLTSVSTEVRYRNKYGQYRWHLVKATPLEQPETGSVWLFGTCTDIDDKRQQEEELRESETRFRTLTNTIPQIVWTATPSGDLDFFNDRWFEHTGLTLQESESGAWRFLIHSEDLPQYLAGWTRALQTGDTYETEFRLRHAAREEEQSAPYHWFLCRAVAQRAPGGEITKWYATWTEIAPSEE